MRTTKIKGKYFAIKYATKRLIQSCRQYPIGKLKGNIITTYWGFENFGDLITPVLLKEIGYTPVNSIRVSFGQFTFVGSILDSIRDDYNGIILGSGFLNDRRQKHLKNALVLGVRGKLSKKLLGIDYNVQLGDGGLILPKFVKDVVSKKYEIGIIPHFSDAEDCRIIKWKEKFGEQSKVINVLNDPKTVFNEICSCKTIVSSSLHGLVVADSVGIPNLWITLSDLYGNNEFKFHDYYSAFNVERKTYIPTGDEHCSEILQRMSLPPNSIEDAIENLYEIFMNLPQYLNKKKT